MDTESRTERNAPETTGIQMETLGGAAPQPATESNKKSGMNRRDFFRFMGAGAVMASAACRRPTEQIVPAVIQPPEITPGIPVYYSSSAPDGTGIIVKTREGRPIKIAGNPDHPLTRGGVSASLAAATMDLYDPDRLRRPFRIVPGKGGPRKSASSDVEIVNEARNHLKKGSYVLLTAPLEGPSSGSIVNAFLKANPGGRHVTFRPDPTLRQIAQGQASSYGKALVPNYRLHKADYILSLDADFLGSMVFPSYYGASFGRTRSLMNGRTKMSRLVVFEANYSVTGSKADERHVLRPGDHPLVALALAYELASGAQRAALKDYEASSIAAALKHKEGLFRAGNFEKVIKKIAGELSAHRGRSLVLAGSPLCSGRAGRELQIAVNLLNTLLGNDGKTVDHAGGLNQDPGSSDSELKKLFQDLKSGKVKTLILADANPAYHLPASFGVADALKKAGYVLSLADRLDESALLSRAVLPLSHFLESWGDSEPVNGLRSVRQPTIRPLYNTRSLEDRLIQLSGGKLAGVSDFHSFLRAEWSGLAGRGASFNKFWTGVLQTGYHLAGRGSLDANRPARNFKRAALGEIRPLKKAVYRDNAAGELTVGLYYNVQVLDGSLANNVYRQELPEPITKIVWENYVSILPATARALKIKQGDIVRLGSGKDTLKLPVHLQPGLHAGTAAIALGYGRTAAGKIANGLGVNALPLVMPLKRGEDALDFSSTKISLTKTGRSKDLATTQKIYRNGFNTEDKAAFAPATMPSAPYGSSGQVVGGQGKFERPLIREASLKNFNKARNHKEMDKLLVPPPVEYPADADVMTSWEHDGLRWHMIVDLNSCTGCGACVTSCHTENNVPAVGPEEVAIGREMSWLRIDRYFKGDEASPDASHQLMLCQHCENAPCENVCPVAATTHSTEGLNLMTYNRCVGTRYCANNCPYKVRRFNFFENWMHMEGLDRVIDMRNKFLHLGADDRPRFRSPQQLGLNPEVGVRTRGVMEKCSFCIQRIAPARQEMKAQGKNRLQDGTVRTACQEVCPTQAIRFGDINDTKSEVHKLVRNKKTQDKRGYQVLDFVGVKPSITYLANIRNRDEA